MDLDLLELVKVSEREGGSVDTDGIGSNNLDKRTVQARIVRDTVGWDTKNM